MKRFQVQGMTCAHCERAVIQAIQNEDAQAQVRVDRAAASVEIESQLSEDRLRVLIQEEGFQVL